MLQKARNNVTQTQIGNIGNSWIDSWTDKPIRPYSFIRIYLDNGCTYIIQVGFNLDDYIIKDSNLYKKKGVFSKELLGKIIGMEGSAEACIEKQKRWER